MIKIELEKIIEQVDGTDLLCVQNNCNSPILRMGDYVLLRKVDEVINSGFYVINTTDLINTDKGKFDIVRVQEMIDGEFVWISQDNVKSFNTKTPVEDFNSIVVGKVIWICKQEDYGAPEYSTILFDIFSDRKALVDQNKRLDRQLEAALLRLGITPELL